MNRPTLRQLEYLVAVADERHFSRAAEACFVTQPALSAQIRELDSLLEANQIVVEHHGTILVRSDPPWGGIFVIRLPPVSSE